MFDQLAQTRIRPEEEFAAIGSVSSRKLLVGAIHRVVHLLEQDSIHVPLEQVVPLASPDDFDYVPTGAAENHLQFLNDLPISTHGSIQALQVAVHYEDQIIEPLARGEKQ